MDLHKIKLTRYILIAMIGGALTGLLLSQFVEFAVNPETGKAILDSKNRPVLEHSFLSDYVINGFFQFLSEAFIRSLTALVVPLVFVSLVCGTAAMDDVRKLGTVGLKTLLLYLATTGIAISIAIVAALLIKPGLGVGEIEMEGYVPGETKSLLNVFIDIFPRNVGASFVDGNMLQIIAASLVFGIALVVSGEHGQRVLNFFKDMNEVIMKLVIIVMLMAPFGVFAKIAQVFAQEGFGTIFALAKYFILVAIVLLIHAFVVYPTMLKIFTGLNPLVFFKKLRNVQLFAFSTASSNATIPVTLRAAEERLGAHNKVASFTVPLGATINMDGTAIMQGVATVFIAQISGIDLSITQYLTVILAATMASIGTAGVPSAGLVMLTMVLGLVGLPPDKIGLIIGIDRLLDMIRTAVNITGDTAITCIVANSEGQLDKKVFNRPVEDEIAS
ncbi:dicarboxylate/amino acid:cation symporter [Candidatus Pelagisphaera phototrophica]|uniref:dicarboxylate/amino acid:cation symporter n=1 Tax=Candidatus Pelagisphaera phototrophica TaxID=2684113 RepID=UPI0019F2CF1E|nr:dicarboxylate/amino acid:cation symporter [Candidatus Pelagisphaera phototrophica]QXD30611.1 dicarboxylate/amino acid:cation symporter [Candidatus Pelagisphaera phototrophica]